MLGGQVYQSPLVIKLKNVLIHVDFNGLKNANSETLYFHESGEFKVKQCI